MGLIEIRPGRRIYKKYGFSVEMCFSIPMEFNRVHSVWRAVLSIGVILVLTLVGAAYSETPKPNAAQRNEIPNPTIPSARIIRAGLVDGYPPYSFAGDNGEPQGYAVDIAKALAEHMGLQIEISVGPRADIYDAFQAKRLDLLLWAPYLKIGDEALEPMPPYGVASDFVFIREEDTDLSGPNDLRDREIIVIEGDIAQYYLTRAGITDKIITAETPLQALEMLSAGTGEAVLLPGPTGLYIADKSNLRKVEAITGPITIYRRNFFFAVPRGERELAAILSQGLDQLRESGELGQIYARWHDLPGWDAVSISRLMFTLLMAAVGLSAIFAAVFVWGMSRNLKAARRARELAREISGREAAEAELRQHRYHLDQLVAERTKQLENDMALLKTESTALQTEADLIRREHRTAKEFHQISGVGHWEYDIDRGLISISEEAFWMYGRPLKAGQPSFEEMNRFYQGESGRRFRAALRSAIEREKTFALELEFTRPDGRSHRHYFRGVPVRDAGGRVCFVRAVIQDITIHGEIVNDLRRALFETTEIVEKTNRAVIIVDRQLAVIGINQTAERYFTSRKENVIGRHFTDEAFPEFKSTEFERQLRRALDNQETAPFEFASGNTDSRQWFEVAIGSISNGFALYIDDISERRRLEESLKESESRFHRLFNSLPHPAILTGYRDGVIVDINKSGELFFGLARQEIIGRTVMEMQLWTNQEERFRFLTELRRKSHIDKREFSFNKPDGVAFIGRLTAAMIPLTGRWHVSAFLEDYTSIRNTETELQRLRETLDNILDYSPNIIFSMTAQGIIKSCNRNFESILQKTGSEIAGRDISVFWPNWRSICPGAGQNVSDSSLDFELEQPIGEEKRTFWVRRIPLAVPNGDGPAYLVIADDITTRLKQVEIADDYVVQMTRAQAEIVRLREQLEDIGKTQENEYLMPVIYEEAGV